MDIEGAVCRDVQPYFLLPLDIIPDPQTLKPSNDISVEPYIASWTRVFPAQQTIIEIFRDLQHVVCWLSASSSKDPEIWKRPPVCAIWLMPLLHRCLMLSGISVADEPRGEERKTPQPDEAFKNALRHAIVLFIAPIRRCFGPPAGSTELHVAKLTLALDQCLKQPVCRTLNKLVLWMLVSGGMEAGIVGTRVAWFASEIVDRCKLAGKSRYDEVREFTTRTVVRLVWLDEVMRPGFELLMGHVQDILSAKSDAESVSSRG